MITVLYSWPAILIVTIGNSGKTTRHLSQPPTLALRSGMAFHELVFFVFILFIFYFLFHILFLLFLSQPVHVAVANGVARNTLADSVGKTVELFVARLQEVNAAGGNVATDPVILSHYQNLTALQPQLLKQIDEIQQKKGQHMYTNMCKIHIYIYMHVPTVLFISIIIILIVIYM